MKAWFGAGMVLAVLAAVQAADLPPREGKPLSEIIKPLEDQRLGTITKVEFDDDLWEVELHKDTEETELYLDPKTGQVNRRKVSRDLHAVLPPRGSKPLSEILRSLEGRGEGVITVIEFEDGVWEATLRQDGRRLKLNVDPQSGRITAQ